MKKSAGGNKEQDKVAKGAYGPERSGGVRVWQKQSARKRSVGGVEVDDSNIKSNG